MLYLSFAIQVKPAPGDEYLTYVTCPAGETQGRLVLPDGLAERCQRLTALPHERLPVAHFDPRDLGRELFEALLPGTIGAMFHESVLRLGADSGLRLELRLDLTDPRLVAIATLPWELLYSERLGGFLALRRRTPIVRYLEVPQPSVAPPAPRVLRILVLAANPRDPGGALDLAAERRHLAKAWAGLGGVEISFVETASRQGLAAALRDAARAGMPHHVLHFMGHGRTDPASGRGRIFLESERGLPVAVDGEQLGRELADFPDLRLVVLNACETGMEPGGAATPFGGVASALVRVGVPAVVAMQRPVSDRAAIEICRVLYGRLAAGDALDTAVGEARLALDRRKHTADQWAIPVLFLRLADGRLFEPRAAADRSRRTRRLAAAAVAAALGGAAALVPSLHPDDPCEEHPAPQTLRLLEAAHRDAAAGDDQRAERRLREAIALEPHLAATHSALAHVELELGRSAAARTSLARAARELPRCALHAYNLGSFHLQREEYEQAVESLRHALELDPRHPAAHADLGRTLYELGALEEAAAVLEEGLGHVEADDGRSGGEVAAALHRNLGRVHLAGGRTGRALAHLERARALLPADDPRRRELVPLLAKGRAAAGDAVAACRELGSILPLYRPAVIHSERQALELADELGCTSAMREEG